MLVSSSRNKMSIKSLMIPCVESQYTQEYIANVLWNQHIVKVSSVTLIPYIKNCVIYSIAYINIAEWCDTEAAYNIIHRLKNEDREVRIVHHDVDWWPIQLNTHNNGNINVGSYTVVFDASYFVKSEAPTACCTDDEEECQEFIEKRPIKGLGNDYYTVDEALDHLWVLNQRYEDVFDENVRYVDAHLLKIEDELLHFENELRIHKAVNKSSNVTQRAIEFGKRKFEDVLEEFPAAFFANDETPNSEVANVRFQQQIRWNCFIARCEVDRNCDKLFV